MICCIAHDDQLHVLRKGIFVLDNHQLVPARTCTPVDPPQAIALYIFTDTMEVDAFSAPDASILLFLAAGTELAVRGIWRQRRCGMYDDFICAIKRRFEEVQADRVAGVHRGLIKRVDTPKTWLRNIREMTCDAIPLLETPKLSPRGRRREARGDTVHDV